MPTEGKQQSFDFNECTIPCGTNTNEANVRCAQSNFIEIKFQYPLKQLETRPNSSSLQNCGNFRVRLPFRLGYEDDDEHGADEGARGKEEHPSMHADYLRNRFEEFHHDEREHPRHAETNGAADASYLHTMNN